MYSVCATCKSFKNLKKINAKFELKSPRFEVPAPFSEDHRQPAQEKLPGLDKIKINAIVALDRIVDKVCYLCDNDSF